MLPNSVKTVIINIRPNAALRCQLVWAKCREVEVKVKMDGLNAKARKVEVKGEMDGLDAKAWKVER